MTPVRAPVDLRTLPAIRAEAERRAEAVQDALHRRGMVSEWAGMSRAARDLRCDAHLDLLTDLTRPASRDAIIRMCIEADIRGVDDQAEISAIITEWTSYRDDIERIAYLAPASLGADHV